MQAYVGGYGTRTSDPFRASLPPLSPPAGDNPHRAYFQPEACVRGSFPRQRPNRWVLHKASRFAKHGDTLPIAETWQPEPWTSLTLGRRPCPGSSAGKRGFGLKRSNARLLLFLILGGYLDLNGMNVVGLLGIERYYLETATDVPSLDAGRLLRPRRGGLHCIQGFGGNL
jgi:hypothetical protein